MKVLLLINWKVKYVDEIPQDIQPSDYVSKKEKFWFFKYFEGDIDVDVIDISANRIIEKIEKKIHFHIFQTLKIIKNINKYDLIMIHGTDSALLLCAIKRVFKIKTPPIVVVDISSFHKADTKGIVYTLCRFASKKIDHLIYHTSSQLEYYREHFPWLTEKSTFIRVGVDFDYWKRKKYENKELKEQYAVCVGYRKRDWNTLIEAYNNVRIKEKLYLIGNPNIKVKNPDIKVLPFIPINELMEYIYNSNFSIIPLDNFNYSFGQLTLLQQMALGIPIVSADVFALKDYIKDSEGIIKYKPYDVNDLKQKLIEVSECSKEKIEFMRQQNIHIVKNILNEKNMALEFEKVCMKFKK